MEKKYGYLHNAVCHTLTLTKDERPFFTVDITGGKTIRNALAKAHLELLAGFADPAFMNDRVGTTGIASLLHDINSMVIEHDDRPFVNDDFANVRYECEYKMSDSEDNTVVLVFTTADGVDLDVDVLSVEGDLLGSTFISHDDPDAKLLVDQVIANGLSAASHAPAVTKANNVSDSVDPNNRAMPAIINTDGMTCNIKINLDSVTFVGLTALTHAAVHVYIDGRRLMEYPTMPMQAIADTLVSMWRQLVLRVPVEPVSLINDDDRATVVKAIGKFFSDHIGLPEMVSMEGGVAAEYGAHINDTVFCRVNIVYSEYDNMLHGTYTYTNIKPAEAELGTSSVSFVVDREYSQDQLLPSDLYRLNANRINTVLGYVPPINELIDNRALPCEAIVALDHNEAIGANGGLLVRLTGDMARFVQITSGNVIIMGNRTYKSIGKPLDGRYNIVVTHDVEKFNEELVAAGFPADSVCAVSSKEEALERANAAIAGTNRKIIIIGGNEIYRMFHDVVNTYHITSIAAVMPNPDTYFKLSELVEADGDDAWSYSPDPDGMHTDASAPDISYTFITATRNN